MSGTDNTSAFPAGFLWGAATAGHQVEGGNTNADLWAMEWTKPSLFAEPSGDACDHYHRYPEDIGLLARLGLNAYRFGVEWSRVEPEPGFFSRAALDHYRRMCDTCRDLGVEPVPTYNHFTCPAWFAADGGWGHPDAADRFARYAEAVTRRLGDVVGRYCTLNEPNLPGVLSATGLMRQGRRRSAAVDAALNLAGDRVGAGADRFRPWIYCDGDLLEIMAGAHRAGGAAIRAVNSRAEVGWTLALPDYQSVPGGEAHAAEARRLASDIWLDVSRADEFVGVQTYTRERFGPDGKIDLAPDEPRTLTGWEVYPEALEHSVRYAAERARVPVLVTENGIATADDTIRLAYTQAALAGLSRCCRDGVDVRGYFHWSLLDNFEWMAGYRPTFGLIAVDRSTFVRTVKPSAEWLGATARANGWDGGD